MNELMEWEEQQQEKKRKEEEEEMMMIYLMRCVLINLLNLELNLQLNWVRKKEIDWELFSWTAMKMTMTMKEEEEEEVEVMMVIEELV